MENTLNNEAINNEVIETENMETAEIIDFPVENEEPKQEKSLLTGIIGVGAVVGAGYGLYRLGKKVFKTTKTFVAGGVQAVRADAVRDDEPEEQETATDVETGEEIAVDEVIEEPKEKKAKKESK